MRIIADSPAGQSRESRNTVCCMTSASMSPLDTALLALREGRIDLDIVVHGAMGPEVKTQVLFQEYLVGNLLVETKDLLLVKLASASR
jgi:hypothetical protein